jgi:hypothetical protein
MAYFRLDLRLRITCPDCAGDAIFITPDSYQDVTNCLRCEGLGWVFVERDEGES